MGPIYDIYYFFQKVILKLYIYLIFSDDFVDDVQKENKAKDKSEESQKREPKTDKRQEEIVTECNYFFNFI